MKRELLTLGGLFFLFGFIMLCVYDKTIYIPPTIETKMFLLIFGLVAIADIVVTRFLVENSTFPENYQHYNSYWIITKLPSLRDGLQFEYIRAQMFLKQ